MTRRRRLLVALAVVLVAAVLAAGGGLWYLRSKVDHIPRVAVSEVLRGGKAEPSTTRATDATTAAPGGAAAPTSTSVASPADDRSSTAINVLLVGVDTATGLAADDPVRTRREAEGVGTNPRPDSILLARIDPKRHRVSLVSFPRDLWVAVNDAGRHDRLNAAMADDGAAQLITAITTNFAVPVDHYVQVDFAQFERLVDVLGGVTIKIDRPLRDTHSGLYLPDTGCVTLDPKQSLAFARSRYLESKDDSGAWVSDLTSDLGRSSRQQDFLVAAMRAALAGGRNPLTLSRLLDRAIESVVLDDAFDTGELTSLALKMRDYDPRRTERYSLPVTPDTIGGRSVLRLRTQSAQPVLDVFRGVETPPAAAADVRVTLRDAGAGADVVQRLQAELGARGITATIGSRTAEGPTTMTFPLTARSQAEALARELTAPITFTLDDDAAAPLTFLVGREFGGVNGVPGTAGPAAANNGGTASPAGSGSGGGDDATVSAKRVGPTGDVTGTC